MKSIILIGFMGSGKTTVGRRLARQLKWPLIDMDTIIVKEQGRSIDDIFAQEGEEAFRRMETETLARYATKPDTIISPGGGVPLRPENRKIMRDNCHVISLYARPEVILDRVDRDVVVRPVLENRKPGQTKLERIVEVMEARREAYAEADLMLDTSDASVEELLATIMKWLESREAE